MSAACSTALPQKVRRAAAAALVFALSFVAVATVAAPVAQAHGPNGLFQVQPSRVTAPLTVSFRVRLIYTNDTEPVTSGATVTVQGSGPGGSAGPAAMAYTGSDGYYTGTLTFPSGGTWSITYLAQNPAAQYGASQVVPDPAPPPTAPAPTAPPQSSVPSTTEPVTTSSETTVLESSTTPTAPVSTTPATPPTSEEEAALSTIPVSSSDAAFDLPLVLLGAVIAAAVLSGTAWAAARGSKR